VTPEVGELQSAPPWTPPPFGYRGRIRQTEPAPCKVSLDDLRKLYISLDRLCMEALDKYLDQYQRPADRSVEEFEAAKANARATGHLVLMVLGTRGEQAVATNPTPLAPEALPDEVLSVTFDSVMALKSNNVAVPNAFEFRLDFSSPPAIVTYDPWNNPTPNNSHLQVTGPDDTWGTAVFNHIMEFLDRRRTRRSWLHSNVFFSAANWLIGIPGSIWLAHRIDGRLFGGQSSALISIRGATAVYTFLLSMLIFRAMIYSLRWAFPRTEIEGSKNAVARGLLATISGSLLLSLAYDVLRAFFASVAP
jgi:hypothetical protein